MTDRADYKRITVTLPKSTGDVSNGTYIIRMLERGLWSKG
jgi:hypothetical protein